MKNRNIQEILEQKIKIGSFKTGDKLYSPFCGECVVSRYCVGGGMVVEHKNQIGEVTVCFDLFSDGTTDAGGEVMLFPSKNMKDWEKFAWEKGVLLSRGSQSCIFMGWAVDDYTCFNGLTIEVKKSQVLTHVRKYNTLDFNMQDDTITNNYCVNLYYKIIEFAPGKEAIPELMNNLPYYQKLVEMFTADNKISKEAIAEGRKDLGDMTKRAFAADFVKKNFPEKGKLYYFENTEIADSYHLAVFEEFLDDGVIAHFRHVLLGAKNGRQYFVDLEIKAKHCKNFRVATKEEIAKHKEITSSFVNISNKLETDCIYAFYLYNRQKIFGIFKGWSQDKSTLQFQYVVISDGTCRYNYQEEYSCKANDILKLDFISLDDRDKYLNMRLSHFQLYQFKPKDWCLMRASGNCMWILCQFSHVDAYRFEDINYVPVGGSEILYSQCIPYEGNEYLLGTTKTPVYGKK